MVDQVIPGSPVRRFTDSDPSGLDKAKGLIYGLAIGDALGWPTEFLKLDRDAGRCIQIVQTLQ